LNKFDFIFIVSAREAGLAGLPFFRSIYTKKSTGFAGDFLQVKTR